MARISAKNCIIGKRYLVGHGERGGVFDGPDNEDSTRSCFALINGNENGPEAEFFSVPDETSCLELIGF